MKKEKAIKCTIIASVVAAVCTLITLICLSVTLCKAEADPSWRKDKEVKYISGVMQTSLNQLMHTKEIYADYKTVGMETYVAIGCYEMPCWPLRKPENFNAGPYVNAIIYIGKYSSYVHFEILKFHGHGGTDYTLKESASLNLIDEDNDGEVEYIAYRWVAYNMYNIIEDIENIDVRGYDLSGQDILFHTFPNATFQNYLSKILQRAEDHDLISVGKDGKITVNELKET